ncbi:MAG: glycosyltransferase [Clostridia bacterium]|nr:glycosyltransferase [Clostridia bacterium]
MTLLFLTSSLDRGGAETHLFSLVTELARRGHSITVLSSGGAMAERLASLGIDHQTLPLHSRSPFALLYSYRFIKRMLRRKQYNLIHAHARIPAFLVARTARRKSIPMITTVHAKFRTTPLLRRCSRWGNYSIAVSEDLKQYLCEHYSLSSERISVIPNGIDTAHFHPSPPKETTERTRLVYLSRLDDDCSEIAFLLCKLAPRIRSHHCDLEIVLGGGGTSLPKLQRLAEQINSSYEKPLIVLLGHLDDPRPLFWEADCVIGASRVALEAMACGVPVILAGNEGFLGLLTPSLLSNAAATNFCCRGAKAATSKLLFDAICKFLSMTKEERIMQTALLSQEIQTHYNMERVAKETLLVYEHICKEFDHTGDGTLVICGYYGDGNTGDHALLRAAIRQAKKANPTFSLYAITAHGKKDEPLFGIRCIGRRSLFSLLRIIRSAKLFVFGGGTLLQDRTSLRSLFYYTFLLNYAKRHSVACELWANGIAPPRSRIARKLIRGALYGCQKIGLRDRRSLSLARELYADAPNLALVLEEDLAQKTPPADQSRVRFLLARYRLLCEDGTARRFAIIAPRGRKLSSQRHMFRWWLTRLISEGIHPVFVPLFPKEDAFLCERLSSEFRGTLLQGVSESDLVGLMCHCQTVASMRLHGLIFASAAGAPFVGFGEDPKIESFCREYGGRYWTEDL